MIHPIVIDSAGGEYMESVLVLEWTRAPGERIEAGETIAIVETAKAATEIAASHGGYLKETFFAVGQEAPIGAQLGTISETQGGETVPVASVPNSGDPVEDTGLTQLFRRDTASRIVATPLARRISRERGIDLAAVKGTGPNGRIKSRDIDAAPTSSLAAMAKNKTPPDRHGEAPIVLLHGFGADRGSWRLVAPLIDRRFRLVMPELPGHGEAANIPPVGVEEIAFAVSDELQSMGIDEAHVVGHSLGGAVALLLARIGRLRIRSLCLMAPVGLGPEIDITFLKGLVGAETTGDLQPWLLKMVARPSSIPAGFAQAILRQRKKNNVRLTQLRLLDVLFPIGEQGIHLAAAMDAVTVPAKVIWGLKDAIIPSAHAFAAPGTAALHLLRDVGHVPQLECPEIVARLIGELARSGH